MNEEFLVIAVHQTAMTTSLPFVHTLLTFLLVNFTFLVIGQYVRPIPFYNSVPEQQQFAREIGAAENNTHSARASKRYLNRDDPNPGDLLDNLYADGLNRPVNIEFAPDGRIFVAEKGGVVKIVNADGTVQAEPWLDISAKVHDAADRGMLGMTLDPDFAVNKWVYLLYVKNPQEGVPNISPDIASQGIIVRYADNNGKADISSLQILLGDGPNNGFPCCSNSHLVGDLAFGLDGTLFASSGDGAHWEWVDDGSNRIPEDATCEQLFPDYDIGAFRAQSLDVFGGKIVRINKENGNGIGPENGLVPNPLYDATNPKSVRSRLWTWGNRNPWRLHVRKDSNAGGPGSLYISDVGFYVWEEWNVVREGGGDYGWPCVVGDEIVEPDYNNAAANPVAAARCQDILKLPRKSPLIYYNHWTTDWAGFTGNSAAGIAIYQGNTYPERYTGDSTDRAVFCADFGYQWIRVFWVDENDNFKADKGFQYLKGGVGTIVGLKSHPVTGNIFYWLLNGQIRQFVPADQPVVNTAPRVYLSATPNSGNVALNGPLTVQFTADGTFDQEGDKISLSWDFGDGSTSNAANPIHVYRTSGVFTVTLTGTDAKGLKGTKTMTMRTNNVGPTVKITSPANNFVFPPVMGQLQTDFKATVTDPDTPGTALAYRWEFRVIHNNHFHMDEFVTADREFSFDLATGVSNLERNILEVYLVVTDDVGNTGQDMIRVRPEGMPNGGPTASLAITPVTGESMLTITLDATGSTDPDQDMMHTVWDFGDGITADTYSEKRTFHTYSRPGTYDVTVTVIDVFGETSTSAPITVTVTGTDPQPTTGVVTTGTATTAPATTGAATTGVATTAAVTTGVDTTGAGPVTTTGPAGTTTGASTDAGTTDVTPSTTESVTTEGSTSGPSSTESATTEAVTTGEELTTGEVPNETSAGITEGAEVSSTTGTKKSSATSVAVSFVTVSIAVVFAVLL